MPKGGAKEKKAQEKAKAKKSEKVLVDKTFGLKNKNKSKKVQAYVSQIQNAAKTAGKSRDVLKREELQRKEKLLKQKAKDEMGEIQTLMKTVVTTKTVVPAGADPKSVLCQHFKAGKCNRGNKCRYSHDLNIERKKTKIDLYSDQREEKKDSMEDWTQDQLEDIVNKKHGHKNSNNPTKIVCKFFIEAIETKKYGWFWQCPNEDKDAGMSCIYQHKLPPGFVLKSDKKKEEVEEEDEVTLEEKIEEQRRQLLESKKAEELTPVTLETFLKWKEEQKQKVADKIEEARKEEVKKSGGKGYNALSGRALFEYDPTLFVDDNDAARADEVAIQSDSEDENEEGVTKDLSHLEVKQDGGAAPINEDLFLDDDEDLPDDE